MQDLIELQVGREEPRPQKSVYLRLVFLVLLRLWILDDAFQGGVDGLHGGPRGALVLVESPPIVALVQPPVRRCCQRNSRR